MSSYTEQLEQQNAELQERLAEAEKKIDYVKQYIKYLDESGYDYSGAPKVLNQIMSGQHVILNYYGKDKILEFYPIQKKKK